VVDDGLVWLVEGEGNSSVDGKDNVIEGDPKTVKSGVTLQVGLLAQFLPFNM
jgi:uncharacterized cupin superfamily protein